MANSNRPGKLKSLQRLKLSWVRPTVEGCLAALALLALSPALLVIAGAVFLDSGSPILFAQTRVGREGNLFRLLKIRTMRQEARGCCITVSGDPRVTRVGRFLRKLKFDELPQLWNVVRGQMSLVGPRPELPKFVDMSKPVWRSVLRVRPGITDPASITYRNEEQLLATADDPIRFYEEILLPDKLRRNLAYLRDRTLWRDVGVIVRTIRCVAFSQQSGAKEAES